MKKLKVYTKFMGIAYLSPKFKMTVSIPIEKDLFDYSYQEVEKKLKGELIKQFPSEYYPKAFLSTMYAVTDFGIRKEIVKDSLTTSYDKDTTIALRDGDIDLVTKTDEKYNFFHILRKYGIVSEMPYNAWWEAKDAKEFYNDIKKLFSQDDKKFVETDIITNPLVINDTNAYKPKSNEKIKEYSLDELFGDIDQMSKYLNEFFSRNAKNKCEKN